MSRRLQILLHKVSAVSDNLLSDIFSCYGALIHHNVCMSSTPAKWTLLQLSFSESSQYSHLKTKKYYSYGS